MTQANGNGLNGAGAGAPHQVQVNPQQAAAMALQFLARAPTTRAERDSYDMVEMFLTAIASGQVQLAAQAPAAGTDAPAQDGAAPQ
jgi:phage gp36-like protein